MVTYKKVFRNEKEADAFAKEHNGKIVVKDKYDGFQRKVVTELVVIFK